MTALLASLAPGALKALRLGWPFLLALGVAGLIWLKAVMPLQVDLRAADAALSVEVADHLRTSTRLVAANDARAAANALAGERMIESAALARALDAERLASRAALDEIASNTHRRIRDADPDWSIVPVPGGVAYELCLGLAALAGGDGIHYAACGSAAGDDDRAGG
jgi:hypothetical protein